MRVSPYVWPLVLEDARLVASTPQYVFAVIKIRFFVNAITSSVGLDS
jgi:hypothetical protein